MNQNFDDIIALALKFLKQGDNDAALVTLTTIQIMRDRERVEPTSSRPS